MREWLRREIGRAPLAWAALLVVLATFAAYANSLGIGFVFDDSHHIVGNPYLRDLAYVPQYFVRPDFFSSLPGHDMYRPVVLATLALDYHWGGHDPLAWRLTALALHALCAVGVLVGFRMLLGQLDRRSRRYSTAGALVAALFFALHPVFTEAVDYASARSSLLAALFVVWTVVLHRHASSRPRGVGRVAWWCGSLVCLSLALLSKEIAIVAPLLLFWIAVQDRRGFLALAPALLLAVGYLYVRHTLLGAATIDFGARAGELAAADPGSGGARPVLWNLYTQARVVAGYLALFVAPVGLCLDRHVRISQTPFEPGVLLGGAIIVTALVLAWRWREKRPLASLGLVWFFVALAPTSSIIPLNQVMAERRLYLPGIGMAFLVAGLLRDRRTPKYLWKAAPAVAVLLAAITLARNAEWSDPVRLWRSTVTTSPQSAGGWNSYGVELRMRGRYSEADPAFRHALELDPHSWDAAFNLGTMYLQRGREGDDYRALQQARQWLEHSLEIRPGAQRSRWFLADTYYAMKRPERAEHAYRELAGLSARLYEMTRYPLARIARDRGRPDEAEWYYRQALKKGTDPVAAHLGLAQLALDQGDKATALAEAQSALLARPHSPDPHRFLARLHQGTALAAHHLFEAERRGYRPTPGARASLLGE